MSLTINETTETPDYFLYALHTQDHPSLLRLVRQEYVFFQD